MTNIADVSNQQIAMAARYKVTKLDGLTVHPEMNGFFMLVRPDGTLVNNPDSLPSSVFAKCFKTAEEAWEAAPHFAADLNACYNALQAIGHNHMLVTRWKKTKRTDVRGLPIKVAHYHCRIYDYDPTNGYNRLIACDGHSTDTMQQAIIHALLLNVSQGLTLAAALY